MRVGTEVEGIIELFRREIKQLQVGIDSIPPQQSWYWAGIADEDTDLIEFRRHGGAFRRGWRGTMGIERGLDTRTSIAAYAHSLMIENVRRTYGELALRRAILGDAALRERAILGPLVERCLHDRLSGPGSAPGCNKSEEERMRRCPTESHFSTVGAAFSAS